MGTCISIHNNILPLNGYIYKVAKCKCIFCCQYENYITTDNIELLLCCYDCLHSLNNNTYNKFIIHNLKNDIFNQNINYLINNQNWYSDRGIVEYSQYNKIDIIELLTNSNLLNKFNIKF